LQNASKSCESDTDIEYVPESSTLESNGRGKKSKNANHKRKQALGDKPGRSACPAKGKSASLSKVTTYNVIHF